MSTRLAGARDAGAPRLCVVTRRPPAASETFIAAHLARLPARCLLLHAAGGDLPRFGADGEALYAAPGSRAAAHAALAGFLAAGGFAAVLAEYGTTAAQVHAACRAAAVPLVVHFHGYDVYKRDRIAPLLPAYREMCRSAAALVAVSRDMARELVRLGALPEKIALCPCGVDVARFAGADPAGAAPTFVGVGRFVEKKGQELTLRAFARALERVPEARLVLAGDGERRAACRDLARRLRIESAVTFPGPLAHEAVADLLRGARAFVQHSRRAADGDSEGTPVAVVEAAAAGLPVVATHHGGIPEAVIDGSTGLLVAEGDERAMADAIALLARSPELAARLGAAARRHAIEHYALEATIARLWAVIARAIGSPVERDAVDGAEGLAQDAAAVALGGEQRGDEV